MPATQYFIVMRDFGRRGLEAVVQPEITRRGMIDRIASGEWDSVAYVHEVRDPGDGEGLIATDITEEVLSEARTLIERRDDFKLVAAE